MIDWIGHPMELERKENMIDQVLAGKFDIEAAQKDYAIQLKEEEKEQREMRPFKKIMGEVYEDMKHQRWDAALADVTAAEKALPEDRRAQMKINLESTRFSVLIGKEDFAAATALASKISDKTRIITGC